MRAVVYDRYGPPEVQRLEEVDRPIPKDGEVLVRIHSTTVTRTDCGLRSACLRTVTVRLSSERLVAPVPASAVYRVDSEGEMTRVAQGKGA